MGGIFLAQQKRKEKDSQPAIGFAKVSKEDVLLPFQGYQESSLLGSANYAQNVLHVYKHGDGSPQRLKIWLIHIRFLTVTSMMSEC